MDFKQVYQKALHDAGSIGALSEKSFLNYRDKYANASSSDDIKNVMGGKIFTFYYKAISQDKSFVNRRPLLFVLSEKVDYSHGIIMGIDLMLMPPLDRFNFLSRLIRVYGEPIHRNFEKIQEGVGITQVRLPVNLDILETLFSGISYKHAYSGFKIDQIQRLKEIHMDDWQNIIYLNTKSLEGASIEEIYSKIK